MHEYNHETCQLRAGTPVLVDRSTGHFWFSSLHALGTDRILCEVGLTDDVAQGKWPGVLYLSEDGGHGWRRLAEPETHSCCSVQLDLADHHNALSRTLLCTTLTCSELQGKGSSRTKAPRTQG